jgi:hypothetical protein
MIMETFFLVEEKRAMRTQNFQDLFRNAIFGDNSNVCLGQSGAAVRQSVFFLSPGEGRPASAALHRGRS